MKDIELTGNLTLKSLQAAVPQLVAHLAPGGFQNITDLYRHLQGRGSLTLRDATLTLPLNEDHTFIGCHKITLINSRIYMNASDTLIICNEFENEKTLITSFTPDSISAPSGADGVAPGANGQDGHDGLHAGTLRVFITDVISSKGLIQLNMPGQRGGRGGLGIPGSKGAKGGRGRNCSSGFMDCKAGCGNGHIGGAGQNGGNGGNGGDGGNGGAAEFFLHGSVSMPEHFFSYAADGGAGGYPGAPGFGGEGGDGGDAGKSGCKNCDGRCYSGPKGPHGAQGAVGIEGIHGSGNFLMRSTFDIDYLKWVLERAFVSDSDANKHERMPVFNMTTGVSNLIH